jgi:hypothetical protein
MKRLRAISQMSLGTLVEQTASLAQSRGDQAIEPIEIAEMAEWQTQWTQNPPWATTCGIKSRSRHQENQGFFTDGRHVKGRFMP